MRDLDLAKPPGVAEAISWAGALNVLGAASLDRETASRTAGAVLKYSEDLRAVRDTGPPPAADEADNCGAVSPDHEPGARVPRPATSRWWPPGSAWRCAARCPPTPAGANGSPAPSPSPAR